jgi:regulator of protease activity HflC (stomatin/prohibitin superfamily)
MAAGAADAPVGVPPSTWLLLAGLLVLAALVASIRVVPGHSRVVVSRLGRVSRVSGPGLVLRLPGLEQVSEVSLQPTRVDVLTPAMSEDGVRVRVHAEALVQVTQPTLSTRLSGGTDPTMAAAAEVESALAREVARRRLPRLLPERAHLERTVAVESSSVTKAWGVKVLRVTVVDVEARLTAELVRSTGRSDSRLPSGPP